VPEKDERDGRENLKTGKELNMTMRKIITISLPLPYKLGTVNCYLIEIDTGHILIDTGCSNNRNDLEKEFESADCKPENLRLIILTHGDFDHTGNAAYLREKFGAKIAMHRDDSGMVERGDMFWNRRKGNILLGLIARILFGFGKKERFKPDLYRIFHIRTSPILIVSAEHYFLFLKLFSFFLVATCVSQ